MAFSNAPQSIPTVFMEVISNHAEQQALYDKPVVNWEEVKRMHLLKVKMNRLRMRAEHILHWNQDKGKAK